MIQQTLGCIVIIILGSVFRNFVRFARGFSARNCSEAL